MLSPTNLYDYQRQAVLHQLQHDDSMLWLEMGLGKTPVTLTTIEHRMRAGQVKKTLVIGPVRVIHAVWQREAEKWEHTRHLRFSVMHGTPKQRERALFAQADIFLCNYENLNWLAEQLLHYYVDRDLPLPFQMVVYDEVSKLKNSTTKRMAGGKRDVVCQRTGRETTIKLHGWRKLVDRFQYRTGLTGTPASNGYLDLHGQFLAVDGGQRLGEYVTHFREAFFASDYMGWGWSPTEQGKQWIEHKISDITLKMDAADYLELPALVPNDVMVDLPPKARKQYDEVERDMFTRLDNGTEVEVFSRSSVSNKCLQFCNGAAYHDEVGNWEAIHDAKLEALDDILEEAAGKPVLLAYNFKTDAERIMKKFKKLRPVNLTGMDAKHTPKVIQDWNAGKIRLLIGHPASMGHGVDGLQDSGNILVWFGLNWSLELYDQMNARLKRNGQKLPVIMHRILCRDTLDLAVADALMRKTEDQTGLKNSIQRYREGGISNDLELTFI